MSFGHESFVLCDAGTSGFPILHASEGYRELYGAEDRCRDLMDMLQMKDSTTKAIEDGSPRFAGQSQLPRLMISYYCKSFLSKPVFMSLGRRLWGFEIWITHLCCVMPCWITSS